jgi:hypothetical protein
MEQEIIVAKHTTTKQIKNTWGNLLYKLRVLLV